MDPKLDRPLRDAQHFGCLSIAELLAFDQHKGLGQRLGQFQQRLLQGHGENARLPDRLLVGVVKLHRWPLASSHPVPLMDRDAKEPGGYVGTPFKPFSSRIRRQKNFRHQILRIVLIAAKAQAKSVQPASELIVELIEGADIALPKTLNAARLVCCQIGGPLGLIVLYRRRFVGKLGLFLKAEPDRIADF